MSDQQLLYGWRKAQPCGNDLIDTGGYKARATRHDQMGDTADVRLLRKSPDVFQRQGGGGICIELHTYRCRWKIILCIQTSRFHWGSVVLGFGQDGPAMRKHAQTRHLPEIYSICVRIERRFGTEIGRAHV